MSVFQELAMSKNPKISTLEIQTIHSQKVSKIIKYAHDAHEHSR